MESPKIVRRRHFGGDPKRVELCDGRAPVSVVEVGADQAEQHLERTRAAGSVLKALFHLLKNVVECVLEVESRRLVGCYGFLGAFPKREFPPDNPTGCFQIVKAFVGATHENIC